MAGKSQYICKGKALPVLFIWFVFVIAVLKGLKKAVEYTYTKEYCESCQIHPNAAGSWKLFANFANNNGIQMKI